MSKTPSEAGWCDGAECEEWTDDRERDGWDIRASDGADLCPDCQRSERDPAARKFVAAHYHRRILSKARPHGIAQHVVHLSLPSGPLAPVCGQKLRPRGGLHSELSGWELEQLRDSRRKECERCRRISRGLDQ